MDTGARNEEVKALLGRLPEENKTLAEAVFLFLARVAEHAHRNKMTSTNLAMLFADILLRPLKADSSGIFHISI